jgi:hypothetical protein
VHGFIDPGMVVQERLCSGVGMFWKGRKNRRDYYTTYTVLVRGTHREYLRKKQDRVESGVDHLHLFELVHGHLETKRTLKGAV